MVHGLDDKMNIMLSGVPATTLVRRYQDLVDVGHLCRSTLWDGNTRTIRVHPPQYKAEDPGVFPFD